MATSIPSAFDGCAKTCRSRIVNRAAASRDHGASERIHNISVRIGRKVVAVCILCMAQPHHCSGVWDGVCPMVPVMKSSKCFNDVAVWKKEEVCNASIATLQHCRLTDSESTGSQGVTSAGSILEIW